MSELTETKQNQNIIGALTYLLGFITGIIFLLVEKHNRFIRFHAMQSVITFGGLFVVNIILQVIPFIGPLVSSLLSLAGLIVWIVLMIKALQGEYYKLPYLGDLAEQYMGKTK
jgi:uncharacterized membrane protein